MTRGQSGHLYSGQLRFHAQFQYGSMELEHESDNLQAVKTWIADKLKDFPNPTHAIIRDTQEDKTIFEEHNPYEP